MMKQSPHTVCSVTQRHHRQDSDRPGDPPCTLHDTIPERHLKKHQQGINVSFARRGLHIPPGVRQPGLEVPSRYMHHVAVVSVCRSQQIRKNRAFGDYVAGYGLAAAIREG